MRHLSLMIILSSLLRIDAQARGPSASSVQVLTPKELTKPDGYEHREALFGIPPYGSKLQEKVYYAGKGQDLCTTFLPPSDWTSPFILMVDRGGCTFTQKVRNVQRIGAVAALIADTSCQCSFKDICKSEDDTRYCENNEPIMADDGSGYDITIPSILLFKQDADPIKSVLIEDSSASTPVQIELSWSIPRLDDGNVEYSLWTSPVDGISSSFKTNFKDVAQAFAPHAHFTPNMYIYDGIKAKCRGADGNNECYNLCTNVDRYCSTDPDGDMNFGVSGADVVTESLRSLCIWQLYGEDGVGAQWWDYNKEFDAKCNNELHFKSMDCIEGAMLHAGIDPQSVSDCMTSSGGLEDSGVNTILQGEVENENANEIIIFPLVKVNGVPLRGAFRSYTFFMAICSAFTPDTLPEVCSRCGNLDAKCDLLECVASNSTTPICNSNVDSFTPKDKNTPKDSNAPKEQTNNPLEEKIMEDVIPAVVNCLWVEDENLSKIAASNGVYESQGAMIFDVIDNYCNEAESAKFEVALTKYKQCSGIDIESFQEDVGDALFGLALYCGRYAYKVLRHEIPYVNGHPKYPFARVPDYCVEAIVGENPFGNLVRRILEYPSADDACFTKLSKEVPMCTLKLWPISIPGSIFQVSSCIKNELLLDEEESCNTQFKILDDCLPDNEAALFDTQKKDKTTCARWIQACAEKYSLWTTLPAPFNGLPLSDACQERSKIFSSALKKFNGFQQSCVSKNDLDFWLVGQGSSTLTAYNRMNSKSGTNSNGSDSNIIFTLLLFFLAGVGIFFGRQHMKRKDYMVASSGDVSSHHFVKEYQIS